MRLVCPNCGAQYEVDDRVIPDSGRDVQCSSCGHAWYQMPGHLEASGEPEPAESEAMAEADDDAATEFEPEAEPEEAAEPAAEVELPAEAVTEAVEVEIEAEATPEAEPEVEPVPETAAEETAAEPATEAAPEAAPEDDETPLPGEPAPDAPPRRDLDQSLRAILQEEVAREMEARAADQEPPATETSSDLQTDSAHDAGEDRPGAGEAPSADFDDDAIPDISATADVEPEAAAGAESAQAPRRELFPDIEEINSTLDSHGLAEEEQHEEEEEGRGGGFGRGFFAIIFIAALALALYLVAPRLAETIPALEPALSAYVDAVNGARVWLDGMVRDLTARIGGGDQP